MQEVEVIESLSPRELKRYQIGGQIYVLMEAGSGAWSKHQDVASHGIKLDAEGRPAAMGDRIGSANLVLVAECLFKLVKKSSGEEIRQKMTLTEIQGWPAGLVQKMHQLVVEGSNIRQREDTEEELLKEMGKLQTRLEKVRNAESNGAASSDGIPNSEAKNSPSATTATSV